MEPIAGHDKYKTASPPDGWTEDEVEEMERRLDTCPFCDRAPYFEDGRGGWTVSCDCGVRMSVNDPEVGLYRWNHRRAG